MREDTHDYEPFSGLHPLEQDGRGGHWTFELGVLLFPIQFFIVAVMFLTVLLTPIGVMLASTGMLSREKYGFFYSHPVPIALTGIFIWVACRMARQAITHALGGGARPRSSLGGDVR